MAVEGTKDTSSLSPNFQFNWEDVVSPTIVGEVAFSQESKNVEEKMKEYRRITQENINLIIVFDVECPKGERRVQWANLDDALNGKIITRDKKRKSYKLAPERWRVTDRKSQSFICDIYTGRQTTSDPVRGFKGERQAPL